MTTVSEKLTTIDNSLKAIKQAIIAKGVTPTGDITTYATAVSNITSGGTSIDTISDWADLINNGQEVYDYTTYQDYRETATVFNIINLPDQSYFSSIDLPKVELMWEAIESRYYNHETVNMPKLKICAAKNFINGTSSYKNTYMTSLSLPQLVIGSFGTFILYAQALQTLRLPSLKIISNNFHFCTYCTALEYLYLPSLLKINFSLTSYCGAEKVFYFRDLESINYRLSYSTNSLDTIVLAGNHVVTLGSVGYINNSNITKFYNGEGSIYVPDNLVDAYKTATNWATLANMIKPLSTFVNPYE